MCVGMVIVFPNAGMSLLCYMNNCYVTCKRSCVFNIFIIHIKCPQTYRIGNYVYMYIVTVLTTKVVYLQTIRLHVGELLYILRMHSVTVYGGALFLILAVPT